MKRPLTLPKLVWSGVVSAVLLLLFGVSVVTSVSVVSSPTPYDLLRGKPYTVDYDHRAVRVNGERVLLLSGGVHYSRSTPAMWPGLMRELRASGLNMVQSYVFWSYHELERGVWDFTTESRNLTSFLQAAADEGLFVNLRMGPYVCGEWTYGGIPVWLRSSWAFRDANPGWLAAMSDFYAVLIPIIEPFLAHNGGPIILTQIENEFGIIEGNPPSVRQQRYVDWCGAYSAALGTDTVWAMCNQMGHPTPSQILVPVDCDRCPQRIIESRSRQQPAMWAENYPVYYSGTMYWGQRPAAGSKTPGDLSYSTAQWFAIGGVHTNYYMFFGGTNFGRHASANVKTSYDYGAPLDEWGLRREPIYTHQTNLHLTLQKYAPALLGNDPANATSLDNGCRLYTYPSSQPDGAQAGGVLIIENPGQRAASTTVGSQHYTLQGESLIFVDAVSMAVVYDTANFSTAVPSTNAKDRSSSALPSVGPTQLSWWSEPIGVWNPKLTLNSSSPLEQINATQYKTRYLWYTTNITIHASSNTLGLSNVNDHVHIFLNEDWLGYDDTINGMKSFKLVTNGSVGSTATLKLMTTNQGLDVFAGAFDVAGVHGAVTWDGSSILHQSWVHSVGTQGENQQLYTEVGGQSVQWSEATLPPRRHLMWYRLLIPTPTPVGDPLLATWQLDLGSMGKGEVWANGFMLGHFWNITYNGKDPSVRYYHLPTEYLAPVNQTNLIVLFEELGGDPSAITLQQRNATIHQHDQRHMRSSDGTKHQNRKPSRG